MSTEQDNSERIASLESFREEVRNYFLLLRADVKDIRSDLRSTFVTKEEFWPVRTIVYGGAGLALVGIAGAILALVFKS